MANVLAYVASISKKEYSNIDTTNEFQFVTSYLQRQYVCSERDEKTCRKKIVPDPFPDRHKQLYGSLSKQMC